MVLDCPYRGGGDGEQEESGITGIDMHLPTASRLMGIGRVAGVGFMPSTGYSQILTSDDQPYGGGMTPAATDETGNPSVSPITSSMGASCGMGPYLPGTPCDQAATAAAASSVTATLASCGMGPYPAGSDCSRAAAQQVLLNPNASGIQLGMSDEAFMIAQEADRAALLNEYPTGDGSGTAPLTTTTGMSVTTMALLAAAAFLAFKAIRG